MRPITNEDIKVLGRIVNISTENVVADASQVYDSNLHKDQQWLNDYFNNKTGNATTSKYGIVRLAASKNDPDNNDVPTIKILRDAIQDAISFILEDPGNSLLDNLNSIKELADALNNDPSFWTWVRDQLALKADKSAFDTLVGRVDNLNQRVTYLEECCQQMHEYVNEFSVTWNQARGGNHVTITPGYVRIGSSVVEINMDNGYVWEVDTTNASQLHTLLENCMDGDYDSFTITNVTRTAGFISGMTLNFSGVRSNITINGNVYKLGTITARSTGATISPVSKTWGNPVGGLRVLAFGVTAKSGYTTRGNTDWSLKDSSNVTVATGQYSNPNSDGSIIINIPETLQNITCFEDYTLEITIPALPTYSVTYTYNTSQVNITNKPTSVPAGGTFSTSIAAKPGYIIGEIRTTMGGQPAYIYTNVGSTTQAISIPNVNGDITVEITSGSSTYSVTKNINHVTWSGPNGSDTTVSAEGIHTYDATVTPASGYQIDSLTVTVNGYDRTSNVYNSSTGRIYINAVIGNIVISGTTSQSGTTPTYGTVTISPDHGTASPSTFSADGTSHTVTITPASGYTTTGMHATSTNSDVSVSVSGNTIIVTGTSSNNAAITVTLPAEGTTPSGPATVNVVINPYDGRGGTATPSSGTATNGQFSSTLQFYQADEYVPSNTYVILTDSNGNIVDQTLPGSTVTANPSATQPEIGYMFSSGYYATLTLSGLADGESYTANVYFVSGMDSLYFDAYGRTNDYSSASTTSLPGRKGCLNYGGSHYSSSAGDYSEPNPFTTAYSYGEIPLPDITTLNVPGSTNQEKLANLANSLVFDFYNLDNNGTDATDMQPNQYMPFSISGDSSTTQNTYVSNTNNYNIRLGGPNNTIPVIDVVCAPFTSSTPSTETYTTDSDNYAVVESDPIFFDYNYGTSEHITNTTGGSRQYVADSCWTNLVYITSTIVPTIQMKVRLFRKGYAIRDVEVEDAPTSGSKQYTIYAAPLSAIDHYTYTVVDDSSNTTIDSGTGGTTGSIDISTHPTITVTFVAIPKSTAQTENLVSTMSYDYSS